MKLYKSLTVATIGAIVAGYEILGSALPGQAVIISTGVVPSPLVITPGLGQVGNVDVSTGVFTPFITNGENFSELAFNDFGKLFGITTSGELYSISQSQGSYTLIGKGEYNDVTLGLGFDKNNRLYATGLGLSSIPPITATPDGNFYSVNQSTGSASLIAKVPNLPSISDIIFNPKNNQFLAISSIVGGGDSTLFSLDLNGAATEIGKIGFSDVYGMAFENGTLYAYTNDGRQLIINQTTGAGVFDKKVTGLTGEIFAAASSISETKSVPEPTSLVGTIVAIFIGWLMKHKQKDSQSA
ncbi:PEP-CTERM sorting domain-containing protein [Nostoc sp. C117]|uniref:PEP-CTERM sorting domain-containing protein n=1 Tax=Nostoc sp. C117 TaxID=3349875 RepID=UPI00370D1516